MAVNSGIGGGPITLGEGDRASLSLDMGQAELLNHKGGQGAVDDLQHRGKQLRLGGEQVLEWDGKGHHQLAHRHPRDDALDQVSGRLCQTAGVQAE